MDVSQEHSIFIFEFVQRSLNVSELLVTIENLLDHNVVLRLQALRLGHQPLGTLFVSIELVIFFSKVIELPLQKTFFSSLLVQIGLEIEQVLLDLLLRLLKMLVLGLKVSFLSLDCSKLLRELLVLFVLPV